MDLSVNEPSMRILSLFYLQGGKTKHFRFKLAARLDRSVSRCSLPSDSLYNAVAKVQQAFLCTLRCGHGTEALATHDSYGLYVSASMRSSACCASCAYASKIRIPQPAGDALSERYCAIRTVALSSAALSGLDRVILMLNQSTDCMLRRRLQLQIRAISEHQHPQPRSDHALHAYHTSS